MQDASTVAHSLVFLLRHPKASSETPMGIAPLLFSEVKRKNGYKKDKTKNVMQRSKRYRKVLTNLKRGLTN